MDVIGASGRVYRLVSAGSHAGGEGTVFEVEGDAGLVAKIYHAPNSERERKILHMVATPPSRSADFAWPLDAVYDKDTGAFVGFVMQKARDSVPLRDIIVYDKRSGVPWSFYVRVAANIAAAVQSLHEVGHVVGDLNPNNVLVDTTTGIVKLIDTDSFHIVDHEEGRIYPCVVAQPECLAPELQGVGRLPGQSFKTMDPALTFTVDTDLFSLAIMIFRTLMNGAHPFNSVIAGVSQSSFTCEDRIEQGACAYFPETAPPGTKLPAYAPPIDALPASTQQLFRQVFVYGSAAVGVASSMASGAAQGALSVAAPATMKAFFSGVGGASSSGIASGAASGAGAGVSPLTVVSEKGRPLASEWRDELSALCDPAGNKLVGCAVVGTHEYTAERSSCPWCETDENFAQVNAPSAQQAYVPLSVAPMATGKAAVIGGNVSQRAAQNPSAGPSQPGGAGTPEPPAADGEEKPHGCCFGFVLVLLAALAVTAIWVVITVFPGLFDRYSVEEALKSAPTVEEVPVAATAASETEPLFVAEAKGLDGYYGYINLHGEWVVKPQFSTACRSLFEDGLALQYDPLTQLYGYVNKAGEYVLSPQYESATGFSDGLAWVRDFRGAGYYFIDATGANVFSATWSGASDFSEGYAWVAAERDDLYGTYSLDVIDAQGNVVGTLNSHGTPLRALDAQAFSDGLARVTFNEGVGYADTSGQVVIQPAWKFASNFSEGLAAVEDLSTHLWGYIDTTGALVIKPQFAQAGAFSGGLAPVRTENGWGYIDTSGQFAIESQFASAREFLDGYASAQDTQTQLYGLIDTQGNWVVQPQFLFTMSSYIADGSSSSVANTSTFRH